jgi:MFS family permease
MFATYRSVLSVPGAAAFTTAAFIARLPIAMIALGIVLYVSDITGSYALAGLLTGVFTLSAAGFAIITSRLLDRYGQYRILPGLIALHGVALIGFTLLVANGSPRPLWFAAIAIAGASQPAIGAAVRARWVYVLHGDGRVRSAFALESILDELVFTIGPLLASTLALQIALPLPLVAAAGISVVGTLVFAALRSSDPPPSGGRHSDLQPRHAWGQPGLLVMISGATGTGIVFGAFEVSAVAFARGLNSAGATGIILAMFALGSMFGGLWFGSRQFGAPLPTQLIWTSLALFIVLVPIPFLPSVLTLSIAAGIAGTAVAPVLITLFSLTQRLVPPHLLTEGLTWSNSGLAIGFSAGAAIGGSLLDTSGTRAGFGLAIGGAFLALVVAVLFRERLRRAIRPPVEGPPPVALNDEPFAGPTPIP